MEGREKRGGREGGGREGWKYIKRGRRGKMEPSGGTQHGRSCGEGVLGYRLKYVLTILLGSISALQPLQIKSVVAVEGLKGYIYVESYKQQFVKQAIEDIGNLRIGRWQQLMVPIKEMTDVLRVVKDTTGIKRGSWVRIKRSVYKDDIAQVGVTGEWVVVSGCDLDVVFLQVDYMDTSRNQVVLKMIPRIDYTRKRGQKRGEGERGVKRRRRPPAKLFDPDLIRYVADSSGNLLCHSLVTVDDQALP